MAGDLNPTDRFIFAGIVEILRDILAAPSLVCQPSDRLVGDLKIDSDDLSFLFIPMIEKRFGVAIPAKAWREVTTVGDAVAVVRSHLP